MALKKWSQAEVLFAPTETTYICIIDGADPENKLISVEDLFQNYVVQEHLITKELIEASLTGNISSHTHSQYLTTISKAMVEAVLTGSITSHTHSVSSITGAVSTSDLVAHVSSSSHLTYDQRTFLNDLMESGILTPGNLAILNLLSINEDGDLVVGTDLIVEGSITAYSLGDPSIVNYNMLDDWAEYSGTMTTWVVAAPLLHTLYADVEDIKADLLLKADTTTEIVAGLGLSGGGDLSENRTLSLNINNLTTDTTTTSDYIAFYRGGAHFKGLISDLPYLFDTRAIYTPLYTDENSVKGGGLFGGGTLENDLFLELDINSLELYSGDLDENLDYLAIYDHLSEKSKKVPLVEFSTAQNPKIRTIYSIVLPSAATVAARCAGAVERTDYPTGWVLSAGTNPADLKIVHNLNRNIVSVTVFKEHNGGLRQLFTNTAFWGILAESTNTLIIEGFSTVQSSVTIQLVFEWEILS